MERLRGPLLGQVLGGKRQYGPAGKCCFGTSLSHFELPRGVNLAWKSLPLYTAPGPPLSHFRPFLVINLAGKCCFGTSLSHFELSRGVNLAWKSLPLYTAPGPPLSHFLPGGQLGLEMLFWRTPLAFLALQGGQLSLEILTVVYGPRATPLALSAF